VNGHAENEEFARLIDALNPWLGEVVIIGGWAHRLHRIHPVAQEIGYGPIGTLDTDVAIPARLNVQGDDLRERLVARRESVCLQTLPRATCSSSEPSFPCNCLGLAGLAFFLRG
jgi:hypothetical protein